MTDSITTQIVGAHFRPPAKALLACLPAGHPLALRPEPTNEYDENAVQVLLRSDSLRDLCNEEFFRDEIERQLAAQGFDLESVLGKAEWHLGYLPKAAKGNPALQEWNVGVQHAIHEVCQLAPAPSPEEYMTVACTLSFDSAGKPACIIPWPPTASIPADGSSPQAGGLPNDCTKHCDTSGRPWLRLSKAKAGQIIETDSGFTCIGTGEKVALLADDHGLYFLCEDGEHYISGQADDGEYCVGLYSLTSELPNGIQGDSADQGEDVLGLSFEESK